MDVIDGGVRTFPQVDFVLWGSYRPFIFSRIYHSSEEDDGPFGYGWTHSYNITLTRRSDEWFEVVTEDGSLLAFVFRPEKIEFLPLMWNKCSLTRQLINPGSPRPIYRMICKTKDGASYVFPDVFWKKLNVRYHVSAIEYSDGSTVRFEPDDGSLPTRIIDPHRRIIRLSYSNGRIEKIFEPGRPPNQPIRYGYDDQGNLTSISYPVDAHTTYTRRYYYADRYDPHNLTRIEDEHGISFYYEYDQSGKCLSSQGDDFGPGPYFKHTFAYDPQERKTIVKRCRGSEIFTEIFSYNKEDLITKIEYKDSGETQEYSYDLSMDGESTLEITETSPAEKSVFKKFVRFDERFNPAEISVGTTESKNEKPETLHIRVFYEDADNPDTPTKILDQNDKPLYITPEAFNRIEEIFRVKEAEKMGQPPNVEDYLAERKDSFGENKTLTIRDKQGLIKKFVYSDGSTGEISYDNAGRYVRLIEKTSASKREERYSYDWLGRVTLVRRVEENGEIRKASNEYDATDLFDETAKYAVNKTGFDGAKTQLLYNKAGLLWNIVKYQAKGPSVTTYEYDAFGNPVRVLLPDGCEIRATYDSRDRLINIVVPSRLFDSWKDYKMGHLIHRE